VNPPSSEEAHFVDTCNHIPGREHQGKVEQTESETVEEGKEDQVETVKAIRCPLEKARG
jgi:hypothetical protein